MSRRFFNKFKHICVVTLAGLALCGCTTLQLLTAAPGKNEAIIAPNISFLLTDPAGFGPNGMIEQLVVAHYANQTLVFETHIQMKPNEIDLIALDSLGRRALTITWRPEGVTFEAAPWLPSLLRPADILANMEIVFGPDVAIASAIRGSQASVTTTAERRVISRDGCDIVVVNYERGSGWNRSAHYRNLALGYSLDISSIETAP